MSVTVSDLLKLIGLTAATAMMIVNETSSCVMFLA